MEQRIQILNKFEQPGMADFLPFPIEPLRAVPTTFPRKRVSNTSSDSGVNSPHVLSPAMPVTPDNSHNLQPYLMPLTWRAKLLNGPLTAIQQFIRNSRKSKNREPKYKCSQTEDPDPQSVLRTHTRQGYKLWILLYLFSFYSWISVPWNSPVLYYNFSFSLFQITVAKCHKIYPNCIWQVSTE